MKVSFEQLKSMVVFAQIVEQGSLTGAAKQLGLSRAVVSYHLKKLETQLHVTLLNRSTRTMTLTEAGSQYYQRCRLIAEHADAANLQIENLKNEPVGLIKMSCPVNVGLELIVPALNEFKQRYPKIDIDLELSDEVVDVIKQGIDLAIRGVVLHDSGLQATKLATMATCLCGSVDYFNHAGIPKTLGDLDKHQWVIYQPSRRMLTLYKGHRDYKVSLKGSMMTNNAAARTAFVVAGHGLAKIPVYDAWPKIKAGALQAVLTDYKTPDIELYGVFPPGGAGSKKLRVLLDHLKDYFAKQLTTLTL
ncbi:LysR family transcriptional regulator [Pseudoalteromonas mariniglutinosa]|uniref:LysR family transcriptional regulator n=1 Tax=Pseudoalteromonas mariniglutinosa TaxID=206042 RepID=UPI00384B456A